ncbi:NAD/NADP transhydrogenase alpha subunit [Variovorax sp. WDL1]|nr:NAD/NADP transhydrogenase alpha subunit [Variovorax sp. WDL1]
MVQDFLIPGQRYGLDDFLRRTSEALGIASERVRAKYGFACSQAMDQLAEIEHVASHFAGSADAEVLVVAFD